MDPQEAAGDTPLVEGATASSKPSCRFMLEASARDNVVFRGIWG